jgi:hypothetical protein
MKTKSIGAQLRALDFQSSEHPTCEHRTTTQKFVDYCPIVKHGYVDEFVSCEDCINMTVKNKEWQTLHSREK